MSGAGAARAAARSAAQMAISASSDDVHLMIPQGRAEWATSFSSEVGCTA
jgi:hypothetical protein